MIKMEQKPEIKKINDIDKENPCPEPCRICHKVIPVRGNNFCDENGDFICEDCLDRPEEYPCPCPEDGEFIKLDDWEAAERKRLNDI
jgi:hypothetical protein